MRARHHRCAVAIAVVAAIAACWAPPPASATFHEMSIREVYPGTSSEPDTEYVELQMWSAGQNLVGGHTLRAYGAGGALVGATTFTHNVSAGANQSTILLATTAAESHFGLTADATLAPSQIDPAGGAVCWESLDCVSWGGFSGALPSPAGSPAIAIPDGMALRRTIVPGCATLLEATDDSDNSAADFAAVFPNPRPNSVAPSEHPCASGGQQGGQGGTAASAPQTLLRRKPPRRTADRTPTFRFVADEAGVTFQCKLDRRRFRACRSPYTSRRLDLGRHTFAVRARDDSGNLDPSPASYAFDVIPR